MKRRTTFLLGLGGLAGCLQSKLARLNVFNWSSYIGRETIPRFEKEHGVRVRYGVYESNEEMLAKVWSGNSGWDVVFPTNYLIEPMRQEKLLHRLDHRLLPKLRHLDREFAGPDLAWGTPYMWTAAGICYSKRVGQRPTSWADLWVDRWAGRVTMLDDPVDLFGACLKKRGRSVNSSSEDDLRAAFSEAKKQRPMIRAYLNAEARDQMVAGDLIAAQMWNTTAEQARQESDDIGFCYPEEGFAMYPDVGVILRESRRLELAHAFLDYLLRPAVAAEVVAEAFTSTCNAGAKALLPEGLRNSEVLYPKQEVLDRGEWVRASPPGAQRLRDRLWTELKAG